MDHVQVFLRSPLFTLRKDPHVPPRAVILEGNVMGTQSGGVQIKIHTWRNDQGAELESDSMTLFIPNTKIDHICVLD